MSTWTDHPSTSGAGTDTIERRALLVALDHLESGIGLYSEEGEVLFRNRSLSRLLVRSAEAERAIERLVADLVRRTRDPAGRRSMEIQRLEQREIRADGLRYRLRGSRIGFDLCGTGATLLVTMEPAAEVALPGPAVGRRLGLTAAQTRVALLLAEGRSNAEIAAELHVSINTVRNHVQRVLHRLGARSRGRVGPLLREAGASEE
jgi:DNA-binding CsgD family transcriptional regulator